MTKEQIHFADVDAINRFSSETFVASPRAITVTSEMIAAFADLTGNHQWIHEPHPYSPDNPYVGQIAHGLLLLSLIPRLLDDEAFEIVGHKVRIIRGFDRVRFTGPVHPPEQLLLSSRNLKAYRANSGKGTIVEREIHLWTDNVVVWTETVLSCTLKLQYF